MKPNKETLNSAKSTTVSGNAPKRFADDERIAMKERAEELDAEQRVPSAKRTAGEDDLRRSTRCRNRIAASPSAFMPSSKPARQLFRQRPGTGCLRTPRTAMSSLSKFAQV